MLSATLTESREIKISNWFSEYGNRLLRFVRSRVSNISEAEDIAQDVWYQLTRQEDLETIEQIGSWLFTTARNRVINFYKKKKNVPFSELNISSEEDDDNSGFDRWVSDNFTDEMVESDEFWEKINTVLSAMPVEQREVFVANELHDISFREMAEITGTPMSTLLARKRYAVLKLREAFENEK